MYFWAAKRILDSRVIGLLLHSLRVVVSSFRVVKVPLFLRESRGVCIVVLVCPELVDKMT